MLADVVVSASNRPEGFGRVIVEAQAMGRPVVATDHGGARETVLPGETGWLVPPGDRNALAAAIERGAGADARRIARRSPSAPSPMPGRISAPSGCAPRTLARLRGDPVSGNPADPVTRSRLATVRSLA